MELLKKVKKSRSKKSKQSDIKYFLTIYLLTETTQKCEHFIDELLALHFQLLFARPSRFDSPMTKLSKSER